MAERRARSRPGAVNDILGFEVASDGKFWQKEAGFARVGGAKNGGN